MAAGAAGLLALSLAVAVQPAGSEVPPPLPARTQVPPDDWLGAVNHYRQAAGVGAVAEHAEWSEGIALHLVYLANTPPDLRTGEYANDHTENPRSPWYTEEGDAAGRASNLGFGGNERHAVEGWMNAPFHAIGILRAGLREAAFARHETGFAGLDVIRGLQEGEMSQPVLYPGPGSVSFLDRFTGENPDPTEPCGPGFTGLPMIAMLPGSPPAGTTASHTLPSGITNDEGSELCVVTAATFNSSDPVYGPTGKAILEGDNAVLVIPRQPLAPGVHQVSINLGTGDTVQWSFTQAPTFDDVPPDAYYTSSVRWLAVNDLTGGLTPSTYQPSGKVTRAQMAAFLHRFAGSPEPSAPLTFSDVPPDAYYADAVRWLSENGVTSGATETTYRPGGHVTRAQMAAFLHRLAGSPEPSAPLAFSDVPPDAYYADGVRWLDEQDVTGGVSARRYAPGTDVTRGQMAAFLHRLDAALH